MRIRQAVRPADASKPVPVNTMGHAAPPPLRQRRRERGSGNRLEGIVRRSGAAAGTGSITRHPTPGSDAISAPLTLHPPQQPTLPPDRREGGESPDSAVVRRGEDGVARLHRHAPENTRRQDRPAAYTMDPALIAGPSRPFRPGHGIDPGALPRGRRARGGDRRVHLNRSSGNPRP